MCYTIRGMDKPKRKPGQQPVKLGEVTVPVPIRMTEGQRDKLKRLGGPKWVRIRIDRAKEDSGDGQ